VIFLGRGGTFPRGRLAFGEEDDMLEWRETVPCSVAWVVVAAASLGCSGTRIDDDGLGGTNAGGIGGGDPDTGDPDAAVADGGGSSSLPPAKGASHFVITSGGCNLVSGFAIPPDGPSVSSTYLSERVEDGIDGASVDCRVVTSADGFAFDGNVQSGSRAFTTIANVAPADSGGYLGTGTVWHTDPNSPALNSDDGACAVSVLPNQDIAPGRVWGNFQCETVSANNQPGIACRAEGSFVFENCAQ
jgi:hypothetical protein